MTARLDPSVTDMEGAAALPRDNGDLVFAAPWEGRSLAMAVALVQRLGLDWEDFRTRLITAISDDPERPYYESWASALEDLVVAHEIADRSELDRRASTTES